MPTPKLQKKANEKKKNKKTKTLDGNLISIVVQSCKKMNNTTLSNTLLEDM
jgi:hypothetical protein